jgi:hypothetical protein
MSNCNIDESSLITPTPQPEEIEIKKMFYNCTECSSLIEILSIDEDKNNIEFICLNKNNDTHKKKMQINQYLEKMKKYIHAIALIVIFIYAKNV